MQDYSHLSDLVKIRNFVNGQIAKIIGRPAEVGHIAEYLMAGIFDIQLFETAVHKASDGYFRSGSLADKTVNIKYRSTRKRILNLEQSFDPFDHADYHLVLHGPNAAEKADDDNNLPFVIETIYLFEVPIMLATLQASGKTKVGRHVPVAKWSEAEIYPKETSQLMSVTTEQRKALSFFVK